MVFDADNIAACERGASAYRQVKELTEKITRLTAENNRFRDEDGFKDIVHNQTNKIIRLEAQFKAKDVEIARLKKELEEEAYIPNVNDCKP